MFAEKTKAADLADKIRLIEKKKTKTPKELSSLEKMKKARKNALAEERNLKGKYFSSEVPELTDLSRQEQDLLAKIDIISRDTLSAYQTLRLKKAKRNVGGSRSNVMGYDELGEEILYAGAFEGAEGRLAALAASADRTVYQTFDAAAGRRIASLMDSPNGKKLDPKKLTPEQMTTYWDEYAIRINHRYRNDPFGRMILENKSVDDIAAWMKSPEGKNYRDQLSVTNREINDDQGLYEYINETVRRLDNELPRDTQLRQLALDHELAPGEVAAALGGRELPIITGRLDDGVPVSGMFNRTIEGVDSITGTIMKYLGTVPENKMLRHPFYKTVQREAKATIRYCCTSR
jgi:hypothetical protein